MEKGIPLTAPLLWCLGTDRPIISAPTRSVLTMYSRREAKKITLKRERCVRACVRARACVCGGKRAHTKATDLIDIQVS